MRSSSCAPAPTTIRAGSTSIPRVPRRWEAMARRRRSVPCTGAGENASRSSSEARVARSARCQSRAASRAVPVSGAGRSEPRAASATSTAPGTPATPGASSTSRSPPIPTKPAARSAASGNALA